MDEDSPTKRCSKCGEDKPISEFYRQPGGLYGVRGDCKACIRAGRKRPPRPRYQRSTDPLPAERECVTCKQTKPLTEEFWRRHNKGGFRHECAACQRMAAVFKRYGVTREQYTQMLLGQGGGCAICEGTGPGKRSGHLLGVDHCHGTNRVRGLLCGNCNLGIDYFRDDPDRCRKGAEYLERPTTGPLVTKGTQADGHTQPTADDGPVKQCRKCNQVKPVTEFHWAKNCAYGVRGTCKLCTGVKRPRSGKGRYLRATDPLPTERRCVACQEDKPLTDEFWYRHSSGGFRHTCRGCTGAVAVLHRYGVTSAQYNQMLDDQGGGCAICGSTDQGKRSRYELSVDHCHGSNRIRGLLCTSCNLAIGYLQDDPALCHKAADYLTNPPAGDAVFASGERAVRDEAKGDAIAEQVTR